MGTGPGTDVRGVARLTRPIAIVVLAAVLALPTARAEEAARESLDRFPTAALTIESGNQRHAFTVWVAATDARRNQGLMYVRSLAAGHGMLFVFRNPQPASFWMKNTFIPLDLLFVAPDGRVIRVVENAVPQSLDTISSMGLVSGVVELAGGSAARLGIRSGDRVHCPALPTL